MTALQKHRHVVLFAKAPRMGRVKTRLARDIGPTQATAFYRQSLMQTLRTVQGRGRWTVWLSVAPDSAVVDPLMCRLARISGAQIVSQGSGNLGDRMDRAMRQLPPGPAVIVGTDIVGLTASHLQTAFRALGNHDAVFGPSPDGGYWLVGLKRRPSVQTPFAPVRWSSDFALADTLGNLPNRFSHALLDSLNDVDTAADLPPPRAKKADT